MNQKNTKLYVYCLIVGCILVTGIAALSASAAESVFQISGKVIVEGDEGDTALAGASVYAIKYSSDELSEITAASDTSAADGSYSLDVPVDSDLGAGDESNKVQLRLMGPDTTEYVTVCSPFLQLLSFPTGYFTNHDIIAQTVDMAEAVLAEISAIGDDYAIDKSKGILIGIVEYEDGDDINGLAGVQFTLTSYPDGGVIDGIQMVYQAADGSWNSQTNSTTTMGNVVVYNIPLLEIGWRDVTLKPTQVDEYHVGYYYWTRVYAYENGDEHRLTFAENLAEKITTPEEESSDDGGGGGGGGCFIAAAMP